MKLVVLDGFTLNPGDLAWEPLKAVADCEIHDRTPPAIVVARAGEAELVLTNKTVLNRETIGALLKVQYIGVLATGYNVVDVAAAQERGICLTNVPNYGTASVAQFTMALMLELAHRVGSHSDSVRAGGWSRSPDFCYWNFPLVELAGLKLGVVGFGRIGRSVAHLAQAFGMEILVHTRTPPDRHPESVRLVSLEEIFRESDVISLHCPLNDQNRQMVNSARLGLMKPTAWLINTSRGPLVDDRALAEALNSGRIAGAAVDVLQVEPPPRDHPLFEAKNCLVTPHIAWATRAARQRLMEIATENVRAFLRGNPQNVVKL